MLKQTHYQLPNACISIVTVSSWQTLCLRATLLCSYTDNVL